MIQSVFCFQAEIPGPEEHLHGQIGTHSRGFKNSCQESYLGSQNQGIIDPLVGVKSEAPKGCVYAHADGAGAQEGVRDKSHS